MARYHRHNSYNLPRSYDKIPRDGDSRRGVIPVVETPREKVERLRASGYVAAPLERPQSTEEQHTRFEGLDLGNKELPAYKYKNEIIDAIDSNRITLLTGPTGSGKTTQLAQFALEAGYDRVVYLLPRRINVDNTGDRLAYELGSQLGEKQARGIVGTAHSEKVTLTEDSLVQVMTSGTFTKMLPSLSEKWQDEKVLILADEVHENNLETEFAAALAVREVEGNDRWRMVFASATPDSGAITESYKEVNGADIPVVAIEGRPHSLEMVEEPTMDIIDAYHTHSAGVRKSMVFVEGKRAINETIHKLKESMGSEEAARTRFFKLHAKISERAKEAVFNMQLNPGERAIIVSTSAGQSGITVPELGLVITSGLTKSPELDEENAPGLPTRLCTQAEIIQRAGRAGRDIDGGKCVLARPVGFDLRRNLDNELYDFVPLEDRDPDMPPEIYHSNISRNVLASAAMGEDFFELNDYLKNSVSPSSIRESYEVLYDLGAVDETNHVTDLGKLMDTFPLRPELARAAAEVVQGKSIAIQAYTLAIAAAIEAGGLADFDNRHGGWDQLLRPTTDDDFIAQLDLMLASREHFRGRSVDEVELMRQGLDFKNVYRAHRQFDKMCRLMGLDARDIDFPDPKPDEEDELREIFLTGMPGLIFKKVATERQKGIYENIWIHGDPAIRREISGRSVIDRMGQAATRIVVGYPRWYVDSRGERHDVVELGFAASPEQIRRVLGHLATRHITPNIRGDRLVGSGKMTLGSIPLGDVRSHELKAKTQDEVKLLVDQIMISRTHAVGALRDMQIDEQSIRKICAERAVGAGSVEELDTRLWEVVATYQDSVAVTG